IKQMAGIDAMNMTRLALNLSETINGVTERHAQVSQQIFPEHQVRAITNGVHPATWTSPAFSALYDQHFPGWRHEPELLVRADCCFGDEPIWEAHRLAKLQLLALIRELTGNNLELDLPLVGFARRMTAYKRPDLLFTDLQRLLTIAHAHPF